MKAVKDGNEIRIEGGYLHRESLKEIPGRRYDGDTKAWFAPCTKKNAALLQILGAELCEELRAFVGPVREVNTADEIPSRRMPIKAEPYKHQVRAFNFALGIFGIEGGRGDGGKG